MSGVKRRVGGRETRRREERIQPYGKIRWDRSRDKKRCCVDRKDGGMQDAADSHSFTSSDSVEGNRCVCVSVETWPAIMSCINNAT